MARVTPTKVATVELAALSFAAFRKNNNQVYKDSSFYDKEQDAVIAVTPNKQLMFEGKLTVTDQDRTDAMAAIEVLTQDRTMRILKGQIVPDFQNTVTNLVVQAECTMFNCGLMAFLPNVASQITARQHKEAEISALSHTSEYLGQVGQKVSVTLEILSSRWAAQYNCWSVNAKDSAGNLVSYFTSKEDCTRNGKYTAKIKRIEQSRYHNGAKVTTLNFVKSQ